MVQHFIIQRSPDAERVDWAMGFIVGATWNPFPEDDMKMAMAFKKRQRSRPLFLFEGTRLRYL